MAGGQHGFTPAIIIAGYEPKSNLEHTFYQRRFSGRLWVRKWSFVRPRRGRLVLYKTNSPLIV